MNEKRQYYFLGAPSEVLVGEPLELEIECDSAMCSLDWVGIYSCVIPTLPGISRRWRYLSAESNYIPSTKDTNSKKQPKPAKQNMSKIRFEPHELPNHSGWFELRVHLDGEYGTANAVSKFYMLDNPISSWRRILLMALCCGMIFTFQSLVNEKGTCSFMDPDVHHTDVIEDIVVKWTIPLNKYFIKYPDIAELAQALSSL